MRVRLLVVQGNPKGKQLVFPPGDYYFGRGAECQVRPNSAMISRQHCLLRIGDKGVSVRDLGSRNGTLVNGALIDQEQPLRTGDQIQIGPLVFELVLEESRTPPPSVLISDPDAGAKTSTSSAEEEADLGSARPMDGTTDSHPSLPPE